MNVFDVIWTTRAMRRLDPSRAIARPVIVRNYEQAAQDDPVVARMLTSALHLADHLGEAPVLLIPCAPSYLRVEASVYPAVQNLMLAARARGLGTTLTQVHREDQTELKQLLGIPESVETFAIIPLGHPLGRWGEGERRPVREVSYWERWGATRDDLPISVRPPART
jgi:nitroreductase